MHREKWPWDFAKEIIPLPRKDWPEAVQRVPGHFREMVRTHLRCHLAAMECKRQRAGSDNLAHEIRG